MDETIEVLGCVAKRTGGGQYEIRTPLGRVILALEADGWVAWWWPKRSQRMRVDVTVEALPTASMAAREATRRLRAIVRACKAVA